MRRTLDTELLQHALMASKDSGRRSIDELRMFGGG